MSAEREYTSPLVFSAPGTADAALAGTKTVTRRLIRSPWVSCRWKASRYSRIYRRTPRVGGVPIGEVLIVDVRRQNLHVIEEDEVRREGFPDYSVEQFLSLFKALHPGHRHPWDVWRIEFRLMEPDHG